MVFFTRTLFILTLVLCFFSCARREQALYQRTPHEQFPHVSTLAQTPVESTRPTPNVAQSVAVVEPVEIVASISNETPRSQTKPVWHTHSVHASATEKTIADQTNNHLKKAQLRKLILKKAVTEAPGQTSGLAIAALVCGILSFFLLGIVLGPLAIIFGGVSLSKIRKEPGLKGRGMAVAGLVLGIVATVILLAVLAARN